LFKGLGYLKRNSGSTLLINRLAAKLIVVRERLGLLVVDLFLFAAMALFFFLATMDATRFLPFPAADFLFLLTGFLLPFTAGILGDKT
jgi:hypothetical protein